MIDSPRLRPKDTPAQEDDYVPETAFRTGEGHENFHTGRGGQGNIHKEKYGGHSNSALGKESIGDKVKHLFGKGKPKEEEGEPTS